MRRCKYCGKQNEKGSTYCIICGEKLNSAPDFTKEQENEFFNCITEKYIKRYSLTPNQQDDLNERLRHANFTSRNFYEKINDIMKDVIVDSLNDKSAVRTIVSKPKEPVKSDFSDAKADIRYGYDFLKLKQEFNIKIRKLKKLVLEDFTESRITKDYFMSHIDYCEKIFNDQLAVIDKIIEFDSDDCEFTENQIENNVEVLKQIIEKINDLTNEIIISICSPDNKREIGILLEEMDNLINSVKEYK